MPAADVCDWREKVVRGVVLTVQYELFGVIIAL